MSHNYKIDFYNTDSQRFNLYNPYRFGFKRQKCPPFWRKNENEIQGNGNSYDFGVRIYDSMLRKWLSVDPSMAKYPQYSLFVSCHNGPTLFYDKNGEDGWVGIEPTTQKYLGHTVLVVDNYVAVNKVINGQVVKLYKKTYK